MREFFRPWRRKIGICTLGIACLFAAGWMRSLWKADGIWLPLKIDSYFVESLHGVVRFYKIIPAEGTPILRGRRLSFASEDAQSASHITYDENGNALPFDPWGMLNATVKSDWILFAVGTGNVTNSRSKAVMIVVRYWPIVIPLAALSAWLLLTKPRSSNQRKIEPVARGEAAT